MSDLGAIEINSSIYGIAFSVVGTIVAWAIADAKSKARLAYMEEKVESLKSYQDEVLQGSVERVSNLEVKLARSEQDRNEIHRMIERLDNVKASKEIVESFRMEVSNLRAEIERRFDTLETLIMRNRQ